MTENDQTQQHYGPYGHPSHIGPFRILRRIGEGGMGIVYEAEQDRPHRLVALKVVKPGIVPADVLRRFELEGEFLGRLQHPGIAQIYQAGVEETEYGRQPYFAMELVRGKRLDDYVRSHAKTLGEKLLLVADLADAVQHAHHRGIIHRDLKPANILVTESGEPKILDFGIARAAHGHLIATVQTVAGEVLGTVSYMSPEQIAGDMSGLDTRSDVYALGVILYEVIAGRPPYELDRKSLAEAARVIHEVEPTRLRTVSRDVPADVETIVAKALAKEKERRYSSAGDLADDIRRFLRDEPISARPPSAAYQVRKFARRHKAIVAGVAACAIILVVGVAATLWQANVARTRAREAELEKAKSEAVTGFLTQMLESVDPTQAKGRDVTMRDALDAATARIDSGTMAAQPEVEISVRNVIGLTYAGLGLLEPAERQLRAAIDAGAKANAKPALRGDSYARLVNVLYESGKYKEAEQAAGEALRLRREAFGPSNRDVASSLDDLGAVIMAQGDANRAEPLMREALALKKSILPADDPKIAVALNNLAFLTWRKGNAKEAETMFREALAIDRRTCGDDNPEVALRLVNIAVTLRDQNKPEEAEPLVREAIAIQRKILGDGHPQLANSLDTLAGTFEDRGDHAEAERLLREALAIAVAAGVQNDQARLNGNLGWVLWKSGKYAEAEPMLRLAVDSIAKTYGPTHRNMRIATSHLAHTLNSRGDARAAEATANDAQGRFRKVPTDRAVVTALVALSHALVAEKRLDEAAPHLREALSTFAGPVPVPIRFAWMQGEAESTLGSVLAAQGQAAEAEKLLLAGYESLKAQRATPTARMRIAIERLVSFYDASGKSADAATWRKRLQELGAAPGGD
jgi:tetratricopeptide (TPR) repeat protein